MFGMVRFVSMKYKVKFALLSSLMLQIMHFLVENNDSAEISESSFSLSFIINWFLKDV